MQRLTPARLLLWLVGLGTVIALIAWQGFVEVAAATAVAGWGILWVSLVQLLPMMADTLGWRELVGRGTAVSLRRLFFARWIGESVNNLLPVARVGGDVLRAWLAHRQAGLPGSTASASVVADLTVTVVTQVVFTFFGLALLLSRGADGVLLQSAAIGAGVLFLMLLGLVTVQWAGFMGALRRLVQTPVLRLRWVRVVSDAQNVGAELREIYRRSGSLAASAFWHLAGWVAGTLEVWLGLWLLGHPVTLVDALILESLIQAVRSAAFFVPGALGVQEGGLILLGGFIGLPPETALALSLLKRIRELLFGVPGLLVWQVSELHRLFLRAVDADASS